MGPTQLDSTVIEWVIANRSEPWVTMAHVLTVAGNTLTLTIVAIAVVLFLALREQRAEALFVGLGSLLGSLTMVGLKQLFERPRPPVNDRLLDIDSYSFPSGHAMMSTVVYGLIAIALFRVFGWVREHRWVMVWAPLLAAGIGVTRIYLGVHWTTDVIFGWLIGAAWVLLCVAVRTAIESRRRVDSTRATNRQK